MKIISKIKWMLTKHKYFVIMDAKDNSVTLSKAVFKELGGENMKCDRVIVTRSQLGYVFTNEHKMSDKDTVLCAIQLNQKHNCIGFETLCPTVNRIFYDYGLKPDISAKLSVEIHFAGDMKYFLILNPNGNKV